MRQIDTSLKKGRGKAQHSLDLIEAMHAAAQKANPITGRGVGYKLFTAGLIPSMDRNEMQRVYRLLKEAREEGKIPWDWIVDETREIERVGTWDDPAQYARCVAQSYRRDFWNQQPHRVQVWSEKGTVTRSLGAVFRQAIDDARRNALHAKTEISPGLHVGDFRELSPEVIADESVELVFTDPPYDGDSVPLYAAAAKEAARILKPGGSMLIYSGHVHLLTVLNAMAEHLDYYWHCVTLHPGRNNQIIRYGIESGFKPILWFVKQHRGDVQTFVHDVVTGERQKDVHEWQQHIEDAEYYIEKLVSKGGTVVDFCVGGGTTLVAAKKLGRQWIGFEIDKETAKAASQRLEGGDEVAEFDDGHPMVETLLKWEQGDDATMAALWKLWRSAA
jgi:hypothetical protein